MHTTALSPPHPLECNVAFLHMYPGYAQRACCMDTLLKLSKSRSSQCSKKEGSTQKETRRKPLQTGAEENKTTTCIESQFIQVGSAFQWSYSVVQALHEENP